MKRAVFFDELENAQTSLHQIKKDVDNSIQQLRKASKSISNIDEDYRKIGQSIIARANALGELSSQLNEGAKILEGVSAHYLAAEKSVYTAISSIKVEEDISWFDLSDQNIKLLITLGYGAGTTIDILNKARKGISAVGDFVEYFNELGITDFSLFENLKETEAFELLDTVKYFADAKKFIESAAAGDELGMMEMLEKYAGKGSKLLLKSTGMSSFAAGGYVAMASTLGENIGEEIVMLINGDPSRSGFVGFASGVWNVTGNVVAETALETAWDIVDDTASVFGVDMDQVYMDLTGKPGLEGFGVGVGMLWDMTTDYYGSMFNNLFGSH